MLLPLGWPPAVGRAQARRVVLGVAGSLWGSGRVPCAVVRCRGAARAGYPPLPYLLGRVGLCSWQVMLGCRCAARLDARSCWGLCGVPALDGAGPPVVRVASAACCWCGLAAGVGGAEVDGSGDVEDVADDVRARTFVALVAVVARDRGGGLVMVAVVLRGE